MSLNERLEFLIHVNAEGAIKGFKAVGDEAEKSLKKGQTGIEKTGATMTKVGAGMVGAAGLIGFGLLELTKKWEEGALAAGKMSTATGLTVEQASRWSVVAKNADTDTATLTSSLGKMDKAARTAPDAFAQLHAQIVTTKNGAIDTQATFLNVVDALNATGGAANNANLATQILGKGWQGMSEVIDQSSTDLKAQLDAVSKQQVFNENDVSKAEQLRDTMKELGNNAQGLALALGKSAAPVIADVTSSLSAMVSGLTAADSATGGMLGKITAIAALGVGAAGALSVIGGQAIKLRDKIMPVGEDGSRSLGRLGTAAIGVGVAVAAFTVISDLMGQHAKQVAADVSELDKRMQALGLTAEEAAREQITEFAAKNKLMSDAMENAGLSAQDLQDAITGGKDKLEAFITKMEQGGGAASRTKVGVGSLSQEIRHMGEAYDQVAASSKTTEDAVSALGETQKQKDAEAAASQKAYVDAALAANKTLVDSEEGVVKAEQDHYKAVQDIIDQGRAAVDAQYAYEKQQQATKEAIEAANATLKDGKSSEDDKTDATYAGIDAALAQGAAYVSSKHDQDDAKKANDDMITSLYGTATALAPDSPIRKGILDYIAQLQGIPTDVHTTITTAYVDTGAPGTHHDSFTPGSTTTTNHDNSVKHAAAGGIFRATPGGVNVNIAEGGHDEAVIPLDGKHGLGPQVTNNFYGITDHDALIEKQNRAMGWAVLTGR